MNDRTWSPDRIEALLTRASELGTPADRIELLSSEFLGVPYVADTLHPDMDQPERLVIRLDAVDCFTFLDYVEAMRTSASGAAFRETLQTVRYRGGVVGRETRNHFFSDWKESNSRRVRDMTGVLGGASVRRTLKHLNRRSDGRPWVDGLPVRSEEVCWIPTLSLTPDILQAMQTGDYVGFYAEAAGLDVTHVGIFLRTGSGAFLRHASKTHGKVLDENFRDYAGKKPGIVILRPGERD